MAESLPTSSKQNEARRQSLDTPPISLSCSSGPLTEDLQCSICLDVFTDPVTTPCGHNFCKTCLKECWDKSQGCNCPFCKETFCKRPDLKINTALRQVVQHFKEKLTLGKLEVICDICDERKMKALKSCLVCQNSYCETHLKPHQRVANLKKHKLIDPVANFEDYTCQKHDKPLELFCKDDQVYVCLLCVVTDHKTHNFVPLEEEYEGKKTQLMKIKTDVQQIIQDRMKKVQDIKHSAEIRRKDTEKNKADFAEFFTALICSIEGCQAELLQMMEEKQKAVEKEDEDLIKNLEQEITDLQRRESELEQLLHTDDHLHLLQIYPSLCSPVNTKNWTGMSINTHLSVETLRRALNQLKDTLDEKFGQIALKKVQQYAVDVTLDPDTAYPYLIVSDDRKQVSCGELKLNLPDNPERFNSCCCLLAKEGFSSGRFYFEVQVKGKTDWSLGVVREFINRKGKITADPENGYWILVLRNRNKYEAWESSFVSLSLKVKPQTVGVFVDYEEGLVSFYDVENSSHIYSFTGQTFTEKLYPYLSPDNNKNGKNVDPLIISQVSFNK